MTEDKPIQPSEEYKQATRIAFLIAGFVQNKLSAAEHIALDDWVNENTDNQEVFERLTDEMNLQQGLRQIEKADTQAALLRITKKIFPGSVSRCSAAPVLMLIRHVLL